MLTHKDGRYKKPIKWMRQAQHDLPLSRMPRINHNPDFKPMPAKYKGWKSLPCIDCETGVAWVSKKWRDKYGENLPPAFQRCQDCKKKDRDEMRAACRKLNIRKAQMGIKKT